MEVTEKMGFAGLIFCSNTKVAVDGWEGGFQQKKSLTGSRRWWLAYNQLCSGTQNGHLG
jgi:hypothetical protein